jgi:DNA replication protein DnaC
MSKLTSLEVALQKLPDFSVIDTAEVAPPVCEACQGTGYIRFDVPFGHPYFGRMVECDAPGCPVVEEHHRQRTERIMQQSTWDVDYGNITFNSFSDLVDQHPNGWDGKRGAFAIASVFAIWDGQPFTLNEAAQHVWEKPWPKGDPRPSNSAVFTGEVGIGKTGLLLSATNLLLARNKPVVFIRTRELITRIQETYKPNYEGESADQRLKFYGGIPNLIMDEFALENYSDDRLEIVENVVRTRDRAGLPMLISTNLSLTDVYAKWKPRIADIVAKAHWVQIGGIKLRQTREKVATW